MARACRVTFAALIAVAGVASGAWTQAPPTQAPPAQAPPAPKPQPAAAPSAESVKRAEQILADAREALGGEKLAALKTFAATGDQARSRQQPGADRVRDPDRAAGQIRPHRRIPGRGHRSDIGGIQRRGADSDSAAAGDAGRARRAPAMVLGAGRLATPMAPRRPAAAAPGAPAQAPPGAPAACPNPAAGWCATTRGSRLRQARRPARCLRAR